jgi:hypothetical protein
VERETMKKLDASITVLVMSGASSLFFNTRRRLHRGEIHTAGEEALPQASEAAVGL